MLNYRRKIFQYIIKKNQLRFVVKMIETNSKVKLRIKYFEKYTIESDSLVNSTNK